MTYRAKKLCRTLAVFLLSVLVLSLLVFVIARLAPGDPLVSYYGERAEKMKPAERAQAEAKLGLDQPIAQQYLIWLKGALRGEFGISYKYKMDVLAVIRARLPFTLQLGGIGFLLTFSCLWDWASCARGMKILFWIARCAKSAPSPAAFRNSGCRWF